MLGGELPLELVNHVCFIALIVLQVADLTHKQVNQSGKSFPELKLLEWVTCQLWFHEKAWVNYINVIFQWCWCVFRAWPPAVKTCFRWARGCIVHLQSLWGQHFASLSCKHPRENNMNGSRVYMLRSDLDSLGWMPLMLLLMQFNHLSHIRLGEVMSSRMAGTGLTTL